MRKHSGQSASFVVYKRRNQHAKFCKTFFNLLLFQLFSRSSTLFFLEPSFATCFLFFTIWKFFPLLVFTLLLTPHLLSTALLILVTPDLQLMNDYNVIIVEYFIDHTIMPKYVKTKRIFNCCLKCLILLVTRLHDAEHRCKRRKLSLAH